MRREKGVPYPFFTPHPILLKTPLLFPLPPGPPQPLMGAGEWGGGRRWQPFLTPPIAVLTSPHHLCPPTWVSKPQHPPILPQHSKCLPQLPLGPSSRGVQQWGRGVPVANLRFTNDMR